MYRTEPMTVLEIPAVCLPGPFPDSSVKHSVLLAHQTSTPVSEGGWARHLKGEMSVLKQGGIHIGIGREQSEQHPVCLGVMTLASSNRSCAKHIPQSMKRTRAMDFVFGLPGNCHLSQNGSTS